MTVRHTKHNIVIGPVNASTRKLLGALAFAEEVAQKLLDKKLTKAEALKALKASSFYKSNSPADKKFANKRMPFVIDQLLAGKMSFEEATMYFTWDIDN
jgi:hypothetical protein